MGCLGCKDVVQAKVDNVEQPKDCWPSHVHGGELLSNLVREEADHSLGVQLAGHAHQDGKPKQSVPGLQEMAEV